MNLVQTFVILKSLFFKVSQAFEICCHDIICINTLFIHYFVLSIVVEER